MCQSKMPCFNSQSMMTRMESKAEDSGSFSIKSMEMEFQNVPGSGVASGVHRVHDIMAWIAYVQVMQDLQ